MSIKISRHSLIFLGVAILAGSCSASNADTTTAISSDGILDCNQGQIERATDIVVFGDTEEALVETALATWLADGAVLVELADKERWVAVIGGKDVAIAVPELNGDGKWVTHAVSTCGDPDSGPAPIDGELDCSGDFIWREMGSIDSNAQGAPTAREALEEALSPFMRQSAQIIFVSERVASLVVGEREQVVASTFQLENGTWVVPDITGCNGFQR